MRKRRFYDPEPRYYDPDPSPEIGIGTLLLVAAGVLAIASWQNPNMINNILYLINPELKEEAEEARKDRLKAIKWFALIVAIIGGIVLLIYLSKRKRRH